MYEHLPTFTSASWTVTALLDSLRNSLGSDRTAGVLRVFAYAVTATGWQELRPSIIKWFGQHSGRSIVAYVGTDHALTDPEALRQMILDKVDVRLMTTYRGVFHPKVIWLRGGSTHAVWIGSNNLTGDGLLQNIEFSTLIKSKDENPDLLKWYDAVHAGSETATDALLGHYETERRVFAARRATTGTFTWTKRREPSPAIVAPPSAATPTVQSQLQFGRPGDLVVEVMPLETGLDGKQIQLPKAAVVRFFRLADSVGASRQLGLTPLGSAARRVLTMTIFGNNTARLSLSELDYRDRPCVVVFRGTGNAEFQFEIVRRSIYPDRYRRLLAACTNQTRSNSRRWSIL